MSPKFEQDGVSQGVMLEGYDIKILSDPSTEDAKAELSIASAFAFYGHAAEGFLALGPKSTLDSVDMQDVGYVRQKHGKPLLAYCLLEGCNTLKWASINWAGIADVVWGYHGKMNVWWRLIGGDDPEWVSTRLYKMPPELPSTSHNIGMVKYRQKLAAAAALRRRRNR